MISPLRKVRIATQRLILRELNPGDTSHLSRFNEDPQVLKYTGEARHFLEGYKDHELQDNGRWVVELREDGVFIGWCGL